MDAQQQLLYDITWHVDSVKDKDGKEEIDFSAETKKLLTFKVNSQTITDEEDRKDFGRMQQMGYRGHVSPPPIGSHGAHLSTPTSVSYFDSYCMVDDFSGNRGKVSESRLEICARISSDPDQAKGDRFMPRFPRSFDFELTGDGGKTLIIKDSNSGSTWILKRD